MAIIWYREPMFDDFLYNYYRAIKLDRSLYRDSKIFENISFFFAGLIIVINGLAGLIAQKTYIETLRTVYNLNNFSASSLFGTVFSSIIGWLIWSTLIYIIGAKLFSEAKISTSFKNVLRYFYVYWKQKNIRNNSSRDISADCGYYELTGSSSSNRKYFVDIQQTCHCYYTL